jgi:diaminopimelate epimerase
MSRRFLKMNGLGNDFVVVESDDFSPTPDQVRAWGDRACGVGFDQLIAISNDGAGSPLVRFWNSDGDEVGACGNGSRCVGWLLMKATGAKQAAFHTAERPLLAMAAGENRVSVDMGEPRLRWDEIPLAEDMDTRNIELQIGPIDNPRLHTPGAVSMGNPHVVFFVDKTPDDAAAAGDGSLIEHHPLFPQAVNVGFAHVLSPDRIRLRVWERGAGLTLACGTGACAALVAAHRRGLVGRLATLVLDGGELEIEWRADNHVIMTGAVAIDGAGMLPEVLA